MFYFGYKFVKFFVELPIFDCKICLFSLKIIPFYHPKTKFKHTLNFTGFVNYQSSSFLKIKVLSFHSFQSYSNLVPSKHMFK